MIATDKEKIRKELLAKRRGLPEATVNQASAQAVELIRTLFEWKNATEALVYWAVRGEIDLRPLITDLWQRDCRVLLPRCRQDDPGQMDLACPTCMDDLAEGAFAIMEPNAEKCPPVKDSSPNIALVPGVGFDRKGNRLGFGGGYYDRLLGTDNMKDTLIVGVAYDFQLIDSIPTQPWDKPVDVVCTENELWRP